MTSTDQAVANPYLDEVLAMYRSTERDQWARDTFSRPWLDKPTSEWPLVRRRAFVARYSFAVPTPEALDLIARHAPILELGAGTGYWAHLLRQMGVDVLAYDKHPPSPETLGKHDQYGFQHTWTSVLPGDERMASKHPDRTLLLIWPSYSNPWPERALRRYRGRTVIYIGEGSGGCTASDEFHERLERDWHEVENATVYQHDGLHDHCWVYQRGQVLTE